MTQLYSLIKSPTVLSENKTQGFIWKYVIPFTWKQALVSYGNAQFSPENKSTILSENTLQPNLHMKSAVSYEK